jgi:hypothetical protein
MIFFYRRKGCKRNLSHLQATLKSLWRIGETVRAASYVDDGWGHGPSVNPLKTEGKKPERAIATTWVQPGPEVPFSDPSWWVEQPHNRLPRTYVARKVA